MTSFDYQRFLEEGFEDIDTINFKGKRTVHQIKYYSTGNKESLTYNEKESGLFKVIENQWIAERNDSIDLIRMVVHGGYAEALKDHFVKANYVFLAKYFLLLNYLHETRTVKIKLSIDMAFELNEGLPFNQLLIEIDNKIKNEFKDFFTEGQTEDFNQIKIDLIRGKIHTTLIKRMAGAKNEKQRQIMGWRMAESCGGVHQLFRFI